MVQLQKGSSETNERSVIYTVHGVDMHFPVYCYISCYPCFPPGLLVQYSSQRQEHTEPQCWSINTHDLIKQPSKQTQIWFAQCTKAGLASLAEESQRPLTCSELFSSPSHCGRTDTAFRKLASNTTPTGFRCSGEVVTTLGQRKGGLFPPIYYLTSHH